MNLENMLRSVTNRKVFTKEKFSILFIATDKVINLQIAVTGLEIHSDAISFSPPNHFYDDFNTEELRETFGVSNHEKIPDHEIVKPELHATGNQSEPPWLMRIHFGNRTHQLHLNTVDLENLFSPQLLTVERYNNRTLLNVGSNFAPLCRNHYRTTGTDHVHGALSLCEGMLASCPPNFFIQLCSAKGSFLLNDGGLYTLLPLPKRKNDHLVRLKRMAPTNNFDFHVIYKRQTTSGSFFYPSATFCGVDTSFERTMRDDPTKMKKHNNNWNAPPGSTQFHHDRLVMELAIFIDNELWLRYSRKYGDQAEDKLKDFIYTVQILYQQPSIEPLIEFSIVRYEIFKTQPKALKGTKHNHGSALSYLNAFCKFQYYLGARKRWDFALLFSGYDIHRPPSDRTISGIARLYGVCDPLNSCLLAEGVDFSSAYIAAHEIGHGLGMLHDEPTCSSDYIMSGSLGAGKVQWSSCSVQSLNNYIRKLDNPPNASALLPGQKYSADEQCQMVHGQTFRRIRINEKGDGICHMLWCGQSSWGRVITSHPALEGTACAAGKYCRGGKCVPDRSNNPPKVVDGQWSKWTSVECSSCECPPISSGLGVLSSARSCSNPPPENGGNACSGSSDRGIVCNRACSNALNEITPKLYMNRICISHKHRLNDAFLTGKGAQLTRFNARACKIFCEVNGTNADSISFRFFGDSMPEGSPCGEGHYCINGKCLKLSCDGKALVANENECPLPSESCGQSSVKKEVDLNDDKMTYLRDFRRSNNLASDENSAPTTTAAYKWSSWSEWSECSVTCGSGTKSRSRTCWQGSCVGDSVQREACRLAPCIEGRSSTTCGPGARARYRRCAFGKCVGANDEVEQCINAPCGQWNAWSFWSACSVSCGPGTRTRTRTCADSSCEGSDREVARCNLRSCQSDGKIVSHYFDHAFGIAGLNGPHVQSVAVLVFDNEIASVQPETVMASHTCQNNASFPVAQSGVRGDSGPSVVPRVELDNELGNATGLAHVWARTLSPKHVNLATGGQNGAHGLCVPVPVAKVYDVDIVLALVLFIPALEISKFSKYVTKKTALMLIWVMLKQHCPRNLLPVCTLSATNGASGVIAWDAVVQAFEKGFAFVKDITAVRRSLQNLSTANCCHATQYFTLDH
ncbi:A disintegrin and metalloproteinase with thrombospondin motifs 17 [Trichinella nativa]|uniref:A disintegrin and metalloproteinase with thrombospondin motifs 17 n=1 Tax=Trichinella nativa TaxID=6335 RepID=A0A0V1LRQ5_9BILA|nr:A disintegrin and metalloproteinase with thrombospondin motifs 17 [Trichinella nativa]